MAIDKVTTLEVSEAIAQGLLILGRDYKKGDNTFLALDLLRQTIKGRLTAKKDSAAKDAGEKHDLMMKNLPKDLPEEALKLFPSRADFIIKEITALQDAINGLGK